MAQANRSRRGSKAEQARRRARAIGHLRRSDPVIGVLIDARPGFDPRAWLKELPPMNLFAAIVFQVVGQQLSLQATRRILDRMRAHFGGIMPAPAQLRAVRPAQLRRAGLSHKKVATLRDLAARFDDGRLDEKALRRLPDEEIEAALTEVPGIGPWTVQGALIIALNRSDIVLPGDLALRKVIQQVYRLDHRPSPAEVLCIAEPWRPYRSLATAYLFAAAFDAARSPEATKRVDGARARAD